MQRVQTLTKLIGVFGEIESTARRARQNAENHAKYPYGPVRPLEYEVEVRTILQTLDRVRQILRDAGE